MTNKPLHPSANNIQTSRLLLRQPTGGDLDALYAIHADPDTNRFNPGGPDTRESAQRKLAAWNEHWEQHGFGYWSVCLNDSHKEPIGIGGIIYKQIGERAGLNLYFRFSPHAWGKGYAGEMAHAALHLAFEQLNAAEVLAKVRPLNLPSRKALERLGMREIGETHDVPGAPPSLIYCLPAAQYRHAE